MSLRSSAEYVRHRTLAILLLALISSIGLAPDTYGQGGYAYEINRVFVQTQSLTVAEVGELVMDFNLVGEDLRGLDGGQLAVLFPSRFEVVEPLTVTFDQESPWTVFDVVASNAVGDSLIIELSVNESLSMEAPDDSAEVCSIELRLPAVKNAETATEFQLAVSARDVSHAWATDWAWSNPITLEPGPLAEVEVTPGTDIFVRVGDTLTCAAQGLDEFGNAIDTLQFAWSLDETSDAIGYFEEHRLILTQVGQGHVVASAGGERGISGRIAVSPEDLAQLVVNIAPQQVVNHPLINTAQILLLDENSNLVTDYDLGADPIQFVTGFGLLSPNILNDTALFSEGVVNFLPAQVRYRGPTGSVEIFAYNSSVISLGVFVSFSGYDISGASDVFGDPLTSVYSGLLTDILVRVVNSGDQLAIQDPTLRAFFKSGGGSVQRFFTPKSGGDQDTVRISLPTTNLPIGQDTLVLVLESRYQPAGSPVLPVLDTLKVPVQVLSSSEFLLEPDSFKPDSVYADHPFSISFDILANGFAGPIDATNLAIHLVNENDSVLTTLMDGPVVYTSFGSGVISYDNIEVEIPGSLVNEAQWYDLQIDYQLVSQGSLLSLAQPAADSILILPQIDLAYSPGSFQPTVVASGQEASFEFNMILDSTSMVEIIDAGSSFQITGSGFSTITNISVPGDTLLAGLNRITTERVFIPTDQLGDTLRVSATIEYRNIGSANSLVAYTDFDGLAIEVQELPLVQIAEVSLVAPNVPFVNTSQAFQVSCKVANLSSSYQGAFQVQIVTDGGSTGDTLVTVPGVPGYDTTEVFFNRMASTTPNPTEIFRVDIATQGINDTTPKDNFAVATTQLPASLSLRYALVGVSNGFVTTGENFSVIVRLDNRAGSAAAGDALFEISTNGVDLGQPDPFTEIVATDVPINVPFTAPPFDTNLSISFTMIDVPLDMNTLEPAIIDLTQFDVNLAVITPGVELLASVEAPTANVVLPGAEKDLFTLTLTNPGASSISDIRMETIILFLRDRNGRALDVRRMLETGSAGFFNGDERVARATAGADRLNMLFDNFVVSAGETTDLVFRSRIKASSGDEFSMHLDVSDIQAVFLTGPMAGDTVTVQSGGDSDTLLNEVFTAVEGTLGGSFVVRDNPFNPMAGSAEFQYFLSEESSIKFRVLTLIGEEVYAQDRRAGEPGTSIGLHSIEWDGRNGNGDVVLNGVYVVVIVAEDSGDHARLKVAVLK